jgi:hypothetical protein
VVLILPLESRKVTAFGTAAPHTTASIRKGSNAEKSRGGEIRTRDLLTPSQTRYQAAPRPDSALHFKP